MKNTKFIHPFIKERLKSDFTTWQIGGEGFSFDGALSFEIIGDFTTCFKLNNGLLAKIFYVDGPFRENKWQNMENKDNVFLIENSFHFMNHFFNFGDWRVNVPRPYGLYLIRREPMGSLYPAFVMDYIHDDFYEMSSKKKKEIKKTRDHMVGAVKEHGFSNLCNFSNQRANFIYSNNQNKVFLAGFSTWIKR